MKVLLLSAYDALSHRYWHQGLVKAFPEIDWKVLTLPARFFHFRVRTNPISWSESETAVLNDCYDLIIATSMVDIVSLRGLFPNLAVVPLWLYCHENHFVYPENATVANREQQTALDLQLEAKLVFFYGCLAADSITFNSNYNMKTAYEGLRKLLKQFPEKLPLTIIDKLEKKSSVLPVPIQQLTFVKKREKEEEEKGGRDLKIIWNHRWEYDKGPEYLLAFIKALVDKQIKCTLNITGQQFREKPKAFIQIESFLKAGQVNVNLGEFGFVESRENYIKLLVNADVVISTALHDFQGIAIQEAVTLGCIPLLPKTLVYPELFSEKYLYEWNEDPEANAIEMVKKIKTWGNNGMPESPDAAKFGWEYLKGEYAGQINRIKRLVLKHQNPIFSDIYAPNKK